MLALLAKKQVPAANMPAAIQALLQTDFPTPMQETLAFTVITQLQELRSSSAPNWEQARPLLQILLRHEFTPQIQLICLEQAVFFSRLPPRGDTLALLNKALQRLPPDQLRGLAPGVFSCLFKILLEECEQVLLSDKRTALELLIILLSTLGPLQQPLPELT